MAKRKRTREKLTAPPREPGTIIQNCSFKTDPQDSEAVTAMARALEANAQALNALANRLDRSAPMIQIGKIDPVP